MNAAVSAAFPVVAVRPQAEKQFAFRDLRP